jgi:hypothetical protein
MRFGVSLRRLVLLVLSVMIGTVLALWVERRLVAELPRPTGPMPVGRTADARDDLTEWIWPVHGARAQRPGRRGLTG